MHKQQFGIPVIMIAALLFSASIAIGATIREQIAAKGLNFTVEEFIERAGTGDLAAVKLFLAAGMDVNARDRMGAKAYTALYEASFQGHLEVVKFLVEHGAKINAKTGHGNIALMAAASGGNLEIARYLAGKGAIIDARNRPGQTPMMSAAIGGHVGIIRFLVAKGADVNAKGGYEQTPLIYAATTNSAESVRFLLEHGAKVNVRDSMLGETALDRTSHPEIVRMLREAGGLKAIELSTFIGRM